jgi:hypothetical protein
MTYRPVSGNRDATICAWSNDKGGSGLFPATTRFPIPLVADQGDLGRDEHDLRDCKPIGKWLEAACIGCSRTGLEGDPDAVLQNAFGLPIFSRRLRSALDRKGIDGVQYLPVKVVHCDGRHIDGFSIANVLNCAHALDRRLSKYDVFPDDYFLPQRRGQIRAIKTPVLMRGALVAFDIIRLAPYKAPIYVSERFVRAFEAIDCTGFSFHEVETSP